jgi:hypothetical protein
MGAKSSAMECHGIPGTGPTLPRTISAYLRSSAVKFAFAEAGLAAAHAVFRQGKDSTADERG